ncbi:PaaI family thioesterase [Nocardia transvalensis]|uniref:PaaI family thioesterase n=1 Tax=Nocardia transvalensis TaxID=37333 RepID=UPI0018955A85|nr:PaaI family thioesterase [Nocardia transvalensis]MBF6328238.1 PaaI family thioesterase [Nocardia transvalensis]
MSDDAIHGHEQVLEHTFGLLRSFPIPPGANLQLPPPSTKTLDMQFEEYVPAKSLTATVTVPQQYANAVGLLQGGFLSAMVDDLFGALSYLTARGPTTSLEMTTQYMRPVFPGERLRLHAVVRKAGRAAIFLAAEARNESDKLVATATCTLQVLPVPTP